MMMSEFHRKHTYAKTINQGFIQSSVWVLILLFLFDGHDSGKIHSEQYNKSCLNKNVHCMSKLIMNYDVNDLTEMMRPFV